MAGLHFNPPAYSGRLHRASALGNHMINYVPHGKALKAMQHLEEEGAQYALELSASISVIKTDLKRTLEAALRHHLVGCEYRIRPGHKKSMLWYLTPKGGDVLDQIRAVEVGA